jgi:uncharacterized protein involved in response to NO
MLRAAKSLPASRTPVPRGIARTGPAILSYGFRPFFLGAGIFAMLSMLGWIGALTLGWDIGGSYGILDWHAHEMLFGYTSAALAGFMLTAIPNWTGRLPVSGRPLLALVSLWLLGRLVMAVPDLLGLPLSMAIDALFLPLLALVAAIEITAGRNWKNLKILIGLLALSLANIGFHLSVAFAGTGMDAVRPTVSIYLMLIVLIGGRIIPSFTRNRLVKAGATRLPKPFGRFDVASMLALFAALLAWSLAPGHGLTIILAVLAAVLQAVRLWRWRGWAVADEPLLLALHVAYGFVPLGLVGIAMAGLGWIAAPSALHILAVGAIGGMTFAVMARATLGHTGRPPSATPRLAVALLALALAAVLRPFAEILPEAYHLLLGLAGLFWFIAYGLFLIELGPMLLRPRRG